MQSSTQKRNWHLYAIIAVLLLIIAGASIHHIPWLKQVVPVFLSDSECAKKYDLINTEVACGPPAVVSKVGYAETQAELQLLIDQRMASQDITFAGLYFRDLENGPAFGINENSEFAPASLLKLPTVLAFFEAFQNKPEIFTESLSFSWLPVSANPYFPPKEPVQPGVKYSIEELLRRTLVFSDNRSYIMLLDFLDQSNQRLVIEETLIDFGLISPKNPAGDVLTVRRYASIFRALYNVSYLDVDTNEKILSWLNDSQFDAGLRAGVPQHIQVASKFGERLTGQEGIVQLHDCGIVYFPNNPYLLCVMTKGDDMNKLSAFIGDVSRIIYQEVESRRINPEQTQASTN